MNKKILYGFLPIFLSLVVLLVPIRVDAAVGSGNLWDGTFSVNFPTSLLYLRFNRYYGLGSSNDISPTYSGLIFESSDNVQIDITSKYSNIYLNGTMRIRVNVNIPSSPANLDLGMLTPSCQPVIMDNVYISTQLITRSDGGTSSYDIFIEFDNYYVEQKTISLPLLVTHTLDGWLNNNVAPGSPEMLYGQVSITSDYAGDVMMYDNLEDVPSVDGYLSQQNQTIIDQSQTQNNLTNHQNTLIQNQTSQQHQDSQAEINQGIANSQAQINQSIHNTDQITNGYNSSQMGDVENKFESGAGDLTDIEDTLTDSSSSYVDNFITSGFDTSFLQSVGPSLNYVVTWFTNFWNMGGALTSIYGLSFAIFIAFYILRVRG